MCFKTGSFGTRGWGTRWLLQGKHKLLLLQGLLGLASRSHLLQILRSDTSPCKTNARMPSKHRHQCCPRGAVTLGGSPRLCTASGSRSVKMQGPCHRRRRERVIAGELGQLMVKFCMISQQLLLQSRSPSSFSLHHWKPLFALNFNYHRDVYHLFIFFIFRSLACSLGRVKVFALLQSILHSMPESSFGTVSLILSLSQNLCNAPYSWGEVQSYLDSKSCLTLWTWPPGVRCEAKQSSKSVVTCNVGHTQHGFL